MKNIILLALLVISINTFAQNNKQRAESLSQNIQKQLSLPKEQKDKVYDAVLANLNLIDKIAKENNGDYNAQPVLIEKRKFFGDMSKILGDEQFQMWQRIRLKQMNEYKNGEKITDMVFDPGMEFNLK